MISYLLDTNHFSAMYKQDSLLMRRIRGITPEVQLGISIPSVAELWYMVFNSVKIEENAIELEKKLHELHCWDFNELAAIEFGRIKAELRRTGRPIPDFDIQIAAVARVNSLVILTADAHFKNIKGLPTENWLI